MELFSFPVVYDVAFQFRNEQHAVDFVEECVQLYTDTSVRSVVDIACGTGHYTREFARRRYLTYGVDIDPAVCQYAWHRARMKSLDMHIVRADMVDFALPQRCDLAVNFFDSLTYVTDFYKLIDHFRIVADLLSPGGLYIIEFGVVDHFDNHNVEEVWTEARREFSVTSTYYRDGAIDPQDHTFSEHCSFRATYYEHCAIFVVKFLKLALYFEEFSWIVRQAGGFTPLAYYEDFDLDACLPKDELPWRVIAVLRKE